MSLHINYSTLDESINSSDSLLDSLGDDLAPMKINHRELFGNIFDFDTDFGESAQLHNLDAPAQNSLFKDGDNVESNLLGDSLASLTPKQLELASESFYLDIDAPIQNTHSDWSDTQSDLKGDSIAPLTSNQLELAGNKSYVGTSSSYWDYTHFNGYGTPIQDSMYWRQQQSNTSCAVVAQAGVYQSITGQFITETTACQVAAASGWYDPAKGTPIGKIGKLLQGLGIPTTKKRNATAQEMLDALAAGNKVIAAVDSDEIWNPLRNSLTGVPVEQEGLADHAVWVTGLDPEPDGSWKVILNDSGSSYGQMNAVDSNDFWNAWADSRNFMMAAAAPGQPLLWA